MPKEQEKFICPVPCEGREVDPDGSVHVVYFPSCRPGDKVSSKEKVLCTPGIRWRCEARKQMLANQKYNQRAIHTRNGSQPRPFVEGGSSRVPIPQD